MPDITAITARIGSIKQAIALAKEIRQATSAMESAELKLQIADLAEALSDAKLNLVGAQDVIVGLQRRIKELEERQNYRDKLILADGVCVIKEPVEGRAPGPYCTGCFDVDNILVTITKLPAIVEMAGKFKCPNCSHIFQCGAKRMDQILATFGHRLIKSLHHEPKGRFESDLLVCHFVVRWSHWDSFDTLGTPALLKISII